VAPIQIPAPRYQYSDTSPVINLTRPHCTIDPSTDLCSEQMKVAYMKSRTGLSSVLALYVLENQEGSTVHYLSEMPRA
jgi:hypothetical protein